MKRPICFHISGALLLLALAHPAAAVTTNEKYEVIQEIARAQGLEQIFDTQIKQGREAAKANGYKILQTMLAQFGDVPNPQAAAAFDRFTARCSSLFSSQEMVNAWASSYGPNLSVNDLKSILAYYKSPVGKMDVAASHAAMQGFTVWYTQQAYSRMTELLAGFTDELKAIKR